ncbi:hypothetical protein HKX48_000947 [Thoreauomyces humboldtii]|nr:hypothetical protein HKX48_000947 [Thoreauomyces humboldtii]
MAPTAFLYKPVPATIVRKRNGVTCRTCGSPSPKAQAWEFRGLPHFVNLIQRSSKLLGQIAVAMSSYEFAGGSLKLKGSSSGSIKKKKSKKSSKQHNEALANAASKHQKDEGASTTSSTDPSGTSKAASDTSRPSSQRNKTPAELKVEEVQKKRQQEKISKIASHSHKDRVANFNKYLEGLSEHYDIPKVGPG